MQGTPGEAVDKIPGVLNESGKNLCQECIDKDRIPACVAYQGEVYHWPRLFHECPLIKAFTLEVMENAKITMQSLGKR